MTYFFFALSFLLVLAAAGLLLVAIKTTGKATPAESQEAEIARLKVELLYAESLIRRLLTKYEPDGGADYGAQYRGCDSRVH